VCMGVREDNFVATAAVGPGAAEPINAQCNFCKSSDRNFEFAQLARINDVHA